MSSLLRSKLSILAQRRLQVERRGGKRVVPVHRTLCLLQEPGSPERTTAIVQNLSLRGVGVMVEREYAPDTVLHALLVNAAHTFSASVDLKVVRCSRGPNNQFFLAGPFDRPLTHAEVIPFII